MASDHTIISFVCPECGQSPKGARPVGAQCEADGAVLIPRSRVSELKKAPLLGTVLADNYAIFDVVGRGGMGMVYKGIHRRLNRFVAVKTIRISAHDSEAEEEFRARFEREAKTLSSLRHPGIVTVYDYGEMNDFTYMVLEFVEGESLHSILRRRKQLPVDEVVHIIRALGEAIRVAHASGVIHRDIKPGNIMLEDAHPLPRVVLLDFGIAKVNPREDETSDGPQTRQGFFVGTLQYMAPEQLLGDEVGPSTDQYAIGCLIYRLLAGETPFKGKATQIAAGHLKSPPPKLPEALGLSKFDAVIARAMGKTPEERYPSSDLLVAALIDAWISTETEGDRRTTQPLDVVAFQKAFKQQQATALIGDDRDMTSMIGDPITMSDAFDTETLTETDEETSHTGLSGALVDPLQPLSGISLAKRGNPKGVWLSWGLVAGLLLIAFTLDWGALFTESSPESTHLRTSPAGDKSTREPPTPSDRVVNPPDRPAQPDTQESKGAVDVIPLMTQVIIETPDAGPIPMVAVVDDEKKDDELAEVLDSNRPDVSEKTVDSQSDDATAEPKSADQAGGDEREARPDDRPPRKTMRRVKKRNRSIRKRRSKQRRSKKKAVGKKDRTQVAAKSSARKAFEQSLSACRCSEAEGHLKAIESESSNGSKAFRDQYTEQCGVVGLGCRKKP